jgi:uncharacterized OB-fold protein
MKIFKCNSCEYGSVTSKYKCPECRTGKLEEKEVSPKGTVFSFTDIHIAPVEFADIAPYTIALIQLDEVDVKVTARMDGSVMIGDNVDLNKIDDGAYLYMKI